MTERDVTVSNRLGLHARASARFVQRASQFDCRVELRCDGRSVNGKSLLDVLSLAAAHGVELCIVTEGEDEEAAAEALEELVLSGFEEAS